MILRWSGSSWSVDSRDAFGGSLFAAATFPGTANEWAVGVSSGNQGLVTVARTSRSGDPRPTGS